MKYNKTNFQCAPAKEFSLERNGKKNGEHFTF